MVFACVLRVWVCGYRYFTYVYKYDILYNIIHIKGMERHFNTVKCLCIVSVSGGQLCVNGGLSSFFLDI